MNQLSSPVDFLSILKQNRDLVWPEIKHYLDQFSSYPEFCRIHDKYQDMSRFHHRIVSEYPSRQGKYLRPALVLLTAQSMGFYVNKAIKTAAAMQVSEDWILNHDDVEDDSLFRRGLPALHRQYSKELAINAGDGLHILMWKILSDNRPLIGDDLTFAIIDEFYTMLNRTVLGQTVEIKWFQDNRTDLSLQDVLFILESKTGYYTIAGPMRLGAILAGATPSQLDSIYRFGVKLGSAFQIRDDLLDLTSTFSGQKDQVGNDIYEGKRTVILVHLLKNASSHNQNKIKEILAKTRNQKTPTDVAYIIDQMRQVGSLEYATSLAAKFASECQEIFQKDLGFLSQQPYRDQLYAGIQFIVNRDH